MDKTDRVLKQFGKPTQMMVTPIATDIVIPNYSGLPKDKTFIDKASNSYFAYNRSTSEVELYVNGVLVASW